MTEASLRSPEGFAVLDKPTGITSQKFLLDIGRAVGPQVKLGHAGTLDSFASGVLICLFGRYTRLSAYFMSSRKAYDAVIEFGSETDTLDPYGQVVATGPAPSAADLEAALPRFRGDILQAPPAYSAVHVDGQRAWERAAKGLDVNPEERPVTIFSLELLSYEGGKAHVLVECSKGTYIRSLARDIALASGSRGHLVELRWTKSGQFGLGDAIAPASFSADRIRRLSLPDVQGLGLETVELDAREGRMFQYGLELRKLASFKDRVGVGPVAAFHDGELLGIAEPKDRSWRYALVFEALR